jgi:hypothetical protein
MSFGFSVGDFLAVAGLIKDITLSLRNASASSYQELVLELHGLQRALHEIEHLQCPPSREAAVNSVKVAALMCQHPLDEFARKLKKYEALEVRHGTNLGAAERLELWRRKLQWAFIYEGGSCEASCLYLCTRWKFEYATYHTRAVCCDSSKTA